MNARIDIVCEVNDGLFFNRVNFSLNIEFDNEDMYENDLVVPVLHTIELYENTSFNETRLVDLSRIKHANRRNVFKLKNYQDKFYVSEKGFLSVRHNALFDREVCDVYELFVDDFRVVVKILDLKDNVPKFYDSAQMRNFNAWTKFCPL